MKNYSPEIGDIILMDFSPSLGHEQKGRRPGLIVSSNILSKTSTFAWIIPISSGPFEYPLHVKLDNRTKTSGTIYVERLTSIDYKARNVLFLEKLPNDLLEEVLLRIHEMTQV
ncbi:type II toxin-antitoxin system PemK/MazF family toxin [Enterococcus timonensis]|uniref:type II toxin-antitoxin system PemK/MazF family toxin n=1 Tax=Enterococcus timonensis TaxID=1852364 RepID=UPI0008DA32A3|nr:type II toxin-antitoxin system PemK/MazF family toxin [Enterococcus timonensis]